jgi:predicted esterase
MAGTTRISLSTLLLLGAAVSYLPSQWTCEAVEHKGTKGDDKDGDNDNSVVILNGGGNKPKPKILALHGGGGNGAGFSRQRGVRDLAAALPQYEFVFANAPEAGGLWLRDPHSKKQPTTDPNWSSKSISYLDKFVAKHGPFYGLMAYSQGTPMSLAYLAHKPCNTFKKIALFNGYAPTTHKGLLASIDRAAPFKTNTLVFSGAKDVFASLSPSLAARFQSTVQIQSRTAGHHLPYSDDATFSQVVSFFQSKAPTTADDKVEDER